MKTNAQTPPTSTPAKIARNPYAAAARAALDSKDASPSEHHARELARVALNPVRSSRHGGYFQNTAVFRLRFPTVYGGSDAHYEIAPARVKDEDADPEDDGSGELVLMAWKKGARYGIGVCRHLPHGQGRFETAEGVVLTDADSDNWLVVGYVLSITADTRSQRFMVSDTGIRVDHRGVPVFPRRKRAEVAA